MSRAWLRLRGGVGPSAAAVRVRLRRCHPLASVEASEGGTLKRDLMTARELVEDDTGLEAGYSAPLVQGKEVLS